MAKAKNKVQVRRLKMKQLIIRSLYAKPSSGLELILVFNEDLKYFVKIGHCYEHKDSINEILNEHALSKAYKSLINNK